MKSEDKKTPKKERGRPEKPVKFDGTLEQMINIAVQTPVKKSNK